MGLMITILRSIGVLEYWSVGVLGIGYWVLGIWDGYSVLGIWYLVLGIWDGYSVLGIWD